MKKVVIYSRYSSDLQDERSIEDQERTCEQYAANQGWVVVKKFADRGISGSNVINRPEIRKLIDGSTSGMFDIVLAEGLDRISRDIGDIATIYKQLCFSDVSIHTLSEGEINEMHVGMKGTMNAIFLSDLKRKTKRGLEGRALKGKSAGGKSYGYDSVWSNRSDGKIEVGDRAINEQEAAVVRRIFTEYVRGKSPKKIAFELNVEGIPAPSGGAWGASTIYGNRQRGTGILNNELYVGRQVWNRQRYLKDPATGKRVSRLNPPSEWIFADVPDLRIIEQDLWDKVKSYQGALEKKAHNRDKRRPVHLLSFLLKCGMCGGGMSIVSPGRYGCSTARNKGTCGCRTTIKKDDLESRVLSALRARLMDPELTKIFCDEYTRHINAARHERNRTLALKQKELAKVERDLERTFQAMLDGASTSFVKSKFEELEARKADLETQLSETDEAPVFVHPNMAKRYADSISDLMEMFNDPEHRQEAAKTIRSLVDEIVLSPNEDASELVADMKGDLAAILSLADSRMKSVRLRTADQMNPSERKEIEQVEKLLHSAALAAEQGFEPCKEKMVAGVGFEPTTFRL